MKHTTQIALTLAALVLSATAARAGDWPQAAANPARTAHVADEPKPGFKVAWKKCWGDEAIFNTCQPIVVAGRVFVGTQNGIVHAVNLEDGERIWNTDVGAPVVHALACDGPNVFVAAFSGDIYALDVEKGSQTWKTKVARRGFSAAPLLMDEKIFIGNRDGFFYALDAKTGSRLWERDTQAPIVHTAAGADGRVVFVNDAMKAFCLDTKDGKVLWATPLCGGAVRDYWPVIHKGKVVIRTQTAGPRRLAGGLAPLQKEFFWPVRYGSQPTDIRYKAKSIDEIVKEQDIIADFYAANPSVRTVYILDMKEGKDLYPASLMATCVNGGVAPPPTLGGDGRLYAAFRTSAATRGFFDITRCALGHFNIDTGKMDEPLLCAGPEGVDKVVGVRQPFELTSDETVTLAGGGSYIYGMRCNETPGAVNVETRQTFGLPKVELPRASDLQPSGNGIVISGDYLLYTKFDYVVCIKGGEEGAARGRRRGPGQADRTRRR
jgi:outer membrane protein assembly factor BamB